jgi:hypothetical protein
MTPSAMVALGATFTLGWINRGKLGTTIVQTAVQGSLTGRTADRQHEGVTRRGLILQGGAKPRHPAIVARQHIAVVIEIAANRRHAARLVTLRDRIDQLPAKAAATHKYDPFH